LLDLTAHVLADRLDGLADLRLVDVDQLDVELRKRTDMGDSIAHLAGTDNADLLDHHCIASFMTVVLAPEASRPITCDRVHSPIPAWPGTDLRPNRNRRLGRWERPRPC